MLLKQTKEKGDQASALDQTAGAENPQELAEDSF